MIKNFNFLPKQYRNNNLKINHNYLSSQFLDHKKILSKIAKVVKQNDFTLGQEVNIFENNIRISIIESLIQTVGILIRILECQRMQKHGDY